MKNPIIEVIGIIYLCIVHSFWIYSFYKGKKIVKYLKLYHLIKWEELGRPRPNYFNSSAIRLWKKFISPKGHALLNDNNLNQLCKTQKKLEINTVILTVSFFVIFGGIVFWFKYFK